MFRIPFLGLLTVFAGIFLMSACGNGNREDSLILQQDRSDTSRSPEGLIDQGAAPELVNDVWLNVDAPLKISSLKGKVVLLDFWTFG